ncbi:MAG: glycoside hydrolase family 127 protein [Planctomycetes bacterium]|nr:glycoside hydrolase family 127 protein [Planctomycetota bacterium]
MSNKSKKTWNPGDPIPYVRQEIPKFDVPPHQGERYETMVPDTLDIQERAALAVNGLTGPLDAGKDYMLYFNVSFRTNPPAMWHRGSDICGVKFEEALPLMRLASGSHLNEQVDGAWMANALRQIGPDGLVYWPFFPWVKTPDWGVHYASRKEAPPRPAEDFYSLPLFTGRRIGAMTLYHLRDPAGPWDQEIRRIVDGLRDIVIDKGDYAYFPQGEFYPNRPRVRDAAMPVGIWSSLVGWTIQGLAQYHRVSRYEPAMDIAGKLARYLVRHGRYYGPDGEFLPNYAGEDGGRVPEKDGVPGFEPGTVEWKKYIHFQHHTVPLLGTLDHALAVGDKELADFVRRAFEWSKTKGNLLVGYFPENIDRVHDLQTSELCEVAGMIGLALKLSAAGLGDYWDDADRWIRNQFAEGQLLQSDWAYRAGTAGPKMPDATFDPVVTCCDRVPERNVGAFAGWPSANDWLGQGPGIMHCCTGNATRALYYIWENILAYENGKLRVNLLLNRASPWADINSHIPYTGQVDVKVKQPVALSVRIPEWVTPDEVRCSVNGQERRIRFDGRYVQVGGVSPGDETTLTFSIAERTDKAWIEKVNYTLIRKGNEVVRIIPPGMIWPLYQREHYRENSTRWRKVERFVSNERICW